MITLAAGLFARDKSRSAHEEVVVIIQGRNNSGLACAGRVKVIRICCILNVSIFSR